MNVALRIELNNGKSAFSLCFMCKSCNEILKENLSLLYITWGNFWAAPSNDCDQINHSY